MHAITQGESIYIALGSVSHPPEECDPPTASLPETEGATRKSKKGASSQKNPRGGMLIITRTFCSYTEVNICTLP